jgi:hypothetical protein
MTDRRRGSLQLADAMAPAHGGYAKLRACAYVAPSIACFVQHLCCIWIPLTRFTGGCGAVGDSLACPLLPAAANEPCSLPYLAALPTVGIQQKCVD